MVPAISTKDYAVGDLICSEMPFVKVVAKEAKSKYCDNCLCQSKIVSLMKCATCMNMHYCSKSCQIEDWKAGHKYECKLYKLHYNSYLQYNNIRQLLRLLFLLKNQKELASRKVNLQYDESVEKSFDDLEKVGSSMGMELELSGILEMFDSWGIEDFDRATVREYFCKKSQNSLSVFLKFDCVAYGIYMSPSVFGHSCVPNATRSFNGCRLDIRAIKEIKKGEPITVSFARVDMNRQERHSYLEDMFVIDCKCERCTSDFDRKFDYASMERLELEMNMAEHIHHQVEKAFHAGKKLTPLYKHLGGYDITVSWHLMRMAELYRKMPNVAQDGGVGDVLQDTVKHVKVTHGVDHPLYKEYLQLLEEYQESKGEAKKPPGQGAVLQEKGTDETAIFNMFSNLSLQFK